MAEEGFSLHEASPDDFPGLARVDGTISNDWVLYLDRRGGPSEQTVELRWRRTKPAGSVRRDPTDLRGRIEELRTEWKRSDLLVLAEAEGKIAGYLMLGTNWNHTAELALIIVDAAYRRRGLGRRFVQEAEAYARERKLRGLQWEVQTDNRNAIEFALSHGFHVAGFHDALYHDDDLQKQEASDFRGIAVFLAKALE